MDSNNDLTHLIKNPNTIFMAMLRRLKLPYNEVRLGVMIPSWLADGIAGYYKGTYASMRLDEYLTKLFCRDGIYNPDMRSGQHEMETAE